MFDSHFNSVSSPSELPDTPRPFLLPTAELHFLRAAERSLSASRLPMWKICGYFSANRVASHPKVSQVEDYCRILISGWKGPASRRCFSMKMRTLALGLMLILVSALAMIAPVEASTGTISIRDLAHLTPDLKFNGSPSFGFRPTTATVQQGSIVTFTNIGVAAHTVTSFHSRALPFPFAPFTLPVPDHIIDSSPTVPVFTELHNFADQINPGQSFTLNTASLSVGTYMIFCKFHPWMLGALVVSLSGQAGASVRITDTFALNDHQAFAGSATWGFLSRTTTVKQGTIVVWTNNGNIQHTVTSGLPGAPDEGLAFNSGFAEDPLHWIFPGMTFSVDTSTLQPGRYLYHCDIHEWMQGTLIVLG